MTGIENAEQALQEGIPVLCSWPPKSPSVLSQPEHPILFLIHPWSDSLNNFRKETSNLERSFFFSFFFFLQRNIFIIGIVPSSLEKMFIELNKIEINLGVGVLHTL